MALTITNLSKTYPNGVRALRNLSLTIGNNMFGLLGPNGAGKSSLMRTIATLQDPDTGTIQLDKLDVLKQKDEIRKILGYLPQEFGVYPKMSAIDMLNHLAVLKGVYRRQRAQGDGGSPASTDESLGSPQKSLIHLFRRHEAALWHCTGAASKSPAHHR